MSSQTEYEPSMLPGWIAKRDGITQRQWRRRKRRELAAVKKAFDTYRIGCVYCPRYDKIKAFSELLKEMIECHSPAKWGR